MQLTLKKKLQSWKNWSACTRYRVKRIDDRRTRIYCPGIITRCDDKEDNFKLVRTCVPQRRLIIVQQRETGSRSRARIRTIEKKSTPISVDLFLFGYHLLRAQPPCSHFVLINRLFMFNATRYSDRRRKFSKLSDGNRGSDVRETVDGGAATSNKGMLLHRCEPCNRLRKKKVVRN